MATRTLAWSGGDRLWVGVDADTRYVPGADAKVVVTGPRSEIKDIVVDDGVIRRQVRRWRWGWRWGRWSEPEVHIVVTAPHLSSAGVGGAGRLDLGRLDQDQLALRVSGSGSTLASGAVKSLKVRVSGSGGARLSDLSAEDVDAGVSGSGWVTAAGACKTLHVGISGSGHANLGALSTDDVDAHISGSGSARLAPRHSANLEISGSGGVNLVTEPQKLSVHRSGAGWVRHPNER